MPASTRPRVTLPPPANLRDLGGLPTVGGGQVGPDRLRRSADLAPVDPTVLHEVCADIDLVVDLRSDAEVAAFGLAELPDHVQRQRVPLQLAPGPHLGGENGQDDHVPVAERRRDLPATPEELGKLYAAGIEASAQRLAETVTLLADQRRATLLHCVAGKDRTGIVAALTLEIIGVERDAIIADYALTAGNMAEVFAQMASAGATVIPGFGAKIDELPPVLFDAPRAAMETCLTLLDDRYGSPAALLGEHGLEAETARRLRQRLVVA